MEDFLLNGEISLLSMEEPIHFWQIDVFSNAMMNKGETVMW